MRRFASVAVGTMLVAAAALGPGALAAPGPRLQEPQAKLDAALSCSPDLASSTREPVLLVPGTSATPENDYGWNYLKILPREGYPVCTLTYRERGMVDLQIQVEYVVNAIRRVAQRSGRKVAIIGHSQGAILNAYALRFWPDLARKVEDFIGVAGTYTYGTDVAKAVCSANCLIPLLYEITPGSPFMAAMARAPLPAGPGYTTYATRTDEAINPQPKAGILDAPGARNYLLQALCPGDLYEHDSFVAAAATVALTLDALKHDGPADLKRPSSIPCGLVPEAADAPSQVPDLVLGNFTQGAGADTVVSKAPVLRCYLDPACPTPRLAPVLSARTTGTRTLTTRGTLELPEGAIGRCAGSVTVMLRSGRRAVVRSTARVMSGTSPTGPDCTFTTRTRPPRQRARRVRVTARYSGSDELLPATATTR